MKLSRSTATVGLVLGTSLNLAIGLPALAADKVTLNDRIDVNGETSLRVNVPVGELDIKTADQSYISIEVEVREGDNWFSSADVDDAELLKEVSGGQISLSVEMEDTEQDWVLVIPRNMDLDLDMGVGKVDLHDIYQSVELDLGVGDAEIDLASDDYRKIKLDTGVGDADLDGFSNVKSERSVVSKSVEWRGNGQYEIEVDIGVGDIDVNL